MDAAPKVNAPSSRRMQHKEVQAQGPYQETTVTDSGSKPLAIVALILAAFALGAMLWALDDASEAKREASIATMRVEGMTRALIAHGIKDTYPHVPGEDE